MMNEKGGISMGTAALIAGLPLFLPTAPYAELYVFEKLIIYNDAAGAPLSYVAIKAILDSAYPIHMPITFWSVALASVILILVLVITISTQIRKVIKSNPVDGLKTE